MGELLNVTDPVPLLPPEGGPVARDRRLTMIRAGSLLQLVEGVGGGCTAPTLAHVCLSSGRQMTWRLK